MSEPTLPTGLIDFGTLSTECRIIPTTPAWEVGREAIDRLSRLAAGQLTEPAVESDALYVRTFAELIRSNSNAIGVALFCGAAVGQARPTSIPSERLLLGLRAISQALRFREKDP